MFIETSFEERKGGWIEELAASSMHEARASAIVNQSRQCKDAPPSTVAIIHRVRILRPIFLKARKEVADRITVVVD